MSTNISVKPEYPMVQNRIQRPGTKRMISDPYRAVQVQWQRFKSKYGRERAKYIRFCPCRIHALPSIYCFTFPILRPLFGIPHLRFLVQDSSFGIPRSGFPVRDSPFGIPRSGFPVRDSPFRIPRSSSLLRVLLSCSLLCRFPLFCNSLFCIFTF